MINKERVEYFCEYIYNNYNVSDVRWYDYHSLFKIKIYIKGFVFAYDLNKNELMVLSNNMILRDITTRLHNEWMDILRRKKEC